MKLHGLVLLIATTVLLTVVLAPANVAADPPVGYTEKYEGWLATTADTWEVKDLSVYGVPANAVCEVVIENLGAGNEYYVGVRANGSSLERKFLLHEAEQGGRDMVTIFVQADSNSKIEHYSDYKTRVSFTLVGYWDSGTYIEKIESFTAGSSITWAEKDLSGYGVGANQICEIVIVNKNAGAEKEAGVRTIGSSLARKVDIHEAEPGGVDAVTMLVKADTYSKIEVYAETDTDIDFYLVGYWTTTPGTYTEKFEDIGKPTADETWEEKDLSGYTVPADAVTEIILANEEAGTENEQGVRKVGSDLARIFDIHEAEDGGRDLVRVHVTANASSKIEFYHEAVSTNYNFYLTGYWSADTTSPTWQNHGQNNSAPVEGDAVLLYAQGKDETALDFAVLETNETGGWLNITDGSYDSPMDMGDAVNTWTWSNFTWQNSSITAGTTVGWRIWYNDTFNNWNKTDIMSFTVQSADNNPPECSNAQTNKTHVYENDSVKFTANWTDDIALAGYKFSTNQTGTWLNSSFVPFSGTSNTSENTTQITATVGTTVGWRFYAKDTSDNWNATDIQSFVVSSPPPPLSSPYMIYGWVFYENQTACNNPVVNITNLNNSKQWQAETNVSYNYYQITLASGTELNASEILQFNVKAPDGSQVNTTYHTVTQAEINNGSLFDFNITLEAPVTPFVIYGWVNYTNGNACNNPAVNITNTNTGMQWQAETHSDHNYYQLLLATTKISAGDVLEFNVTDGTESNSTNHTVTAGDINSGGIFDFNLTLPAGSSTDGPAVDSITITPDDDGTTSGVQVDPYPGGPKTVTVSAVVSDPNGYGDISTVNITNIDPDPAHGDPSNVILVYQSGSGSGTIATYNGTFDMQFYDLPDEYTVTVTAKDAGGLSDIGSSTFNYTSCNAMSLDSGTIAFGSIDPGENNTVVGDTNMTTSSPTVRNIGNVEIDVNITGSNMIFGSDTITKDQMDAQVGALGYSNLSVPQCFDVNMATGASSLENVDFRLNVPYGIPAGSYTGSVMLTVGTCG